MPNAGSLALLAEHLGIDASSIAVVSGHGCPERGPRVCVGPVEKIETQVIFIRMSWANPTGSGMLELK
jgi:hypothetical protein